MVYIIYGHFVDGWGLKENLLLYQITGFMKVDWLSYVIPVYRCNANQKSIKKEVTKK